MNQYLDLPTAIYDVCQQWCQKHGYSELFCRNGEWWAFPPNGVIPLPLKDTISNKRQYSQEIKIGRVSVRLLPDGSFDTGSKDQNCFK
ncbi:MAG: hypothetical protein AAGA16_12260 [Cyanobacteria bacterium P01_E01_bin.35]